MSRRGAIAGCLLAAFALRAEPLATMKDQLAAAHIGIDHASLITALQNPNFELRSLASLQLADNKDTEAIPDLAEALAREEEPNAAVNIARSLAMLGDSRGPVMLEAQCWSNANSIATIAALYLLRDLQSTACLKPIMEMADRADASNTVARGAALQFLPKFFERISLSERERSLDIIRKALSDPDLGTRIAAVQARSMIPDDQTVGDIEIAVAKETDSVVLPFLEEVLHGAKTSSAPARSGTRSSP